MVDTLKNSISAIQETAQSPLNQADSLFSFILPILKMLPPFGILLLLGWISFWFLRYKFGNGQKGEKKDVTLSESGNGGNGGGNNTISQSSTGLSPEDRRRIDSIEQDCIRMSRNIEELHNANRDESLNKQNLMLIVGQLKGNIEQISAQIAIIANSQNNHLNQSSTQARNP